MNLPIVEEVHAPVREGKRCKRFTLPIAFFAYHKESCRVHGAFLASACSHQELGGDCQWTITRYVQVSPPIVVEKAMLHWVQTLTLFKPDAERQFRFREVPWGGSLQGQFPECSTARWSGWPLTKVELKHLESVWGNDSCTLRTGIRFAQAAHIVPVIARRREVN